MTQLIFNVQQFNIIKTTSFFANFERNSNLFNYKESLILTNAIKFKVETMKRFYNENANKIDKILK